MILIQRYEALYESSGPSPDFHRLSKFQPIDFQYLLPDNKDSKLSATWETAIAEAKVRQTYISSHHYFYRRLAKVRQKKRAKSSR